MTEQDLMTAVKKNDESAVATMIKNGVDINAADSSGDYPLIMAAYKGYTRITKMLLEAGADVRVLDPGMKATALHAAAYAGHAEPSKLLIKFGVDINKQGPNNGYTALHDAIWQNNIDVAKVIIDAGPNLALRSEEGETPLEMAKKRKRKEIIALIEAKLTP
ncbi:MAG: ankyrin repeat domain-containing protein [Deltaproteobacteria bacterium]|nr:ankyrin repeat domain-containing protein [Deltaproteobacteria bacterium]